jgi:hypothetical protein
MMMITMMMIMLGKSGQFVEGSTICGAFPRETNCSDAEPTGYAVPLRMCVAVVLGSAMV